MEASNKLTVFHQAQNQLGEGVVWISELDSVLWVDIESRLILRKSLDGDHFQSWQLTRKPTAIAPWVGTCLMVATESGLSLFDMANGNEHELLAIYDLGGDVRMNDGTVDPFGRFWVGSMHVSGTEPVGKLYCVHADGKVTVALEGIGICNGIVFADQGRTMYFADSAEGTIYKCHVNIDKGEVGKCELFAAAGLTDGTPDGAAIDNEGYLWSCQWDGWSVARFAPDGSLESSLRLPVQRPTRCAFGGSDGGVLFITTARTGLDESALAEQPSAGSLMAVRPGISGPESASVTADIARPICW